MRSQAAVWRRLCQSLEDVHAGQVRASVAYLARPLLIEVIFAWFSRVATALCHESAFLWPSACRLRHVCAAQSDERETALPAVNSVGRIFDRLRS